MQLESRQSRVKCVYAGHCSAQMRGLLCMRSMCSCMTWATMCNVMCAVQLAAPDAVHCLRLRQRGQQHLRSSAASIQACMCWDERQLRQDGCDLQSRASRMAGERCALSATACVGQHACDCVIYRAAACKVSKTVRHRQLHAALHSVADDAKLFRALLHAVLMLKMLTQGGMDSICL